MSAINPSVIGVGSFLVQSLFVFYINERERERERGREREGREREERGLLCFYCLPVVYRLLFYVALPRGAVGWSAVCDCGISCVYMLFKMCFCMCKHEIL